MADDRERTSIEVWQCDLPYIDPFDACAMFDGRHISALLDSCGPIREETRFSYLAVDPFRVLSVVAEQVLMDGHPVVGCALDLLSRELDAWHVAPDPDGFSFRGGAVGYTGYEFGSNLELIPSPPAGADDPPDLFIGFYDLVIGFDRGTRVCRAHATGLPYVNPAARAAYAASRLQWVTDVLGRGDHPVHDALPRLPFRPDWDRDAYVRQMCRLRDYIEAGDIFQANLTMRHTAPRPEGLRAGAVHAALRGSNPAPFGAWLRCGAYDLCCTSPERFLAVSATGEIEARPIKGTVARSSDAQLDQQARDWLLTSIKDRAENVMIVDVLRHDVGKVAALGSVSVPSLCALESFATVHHLVSEVRGRLRDGVDAVEALRAGLPGGSISGAPKVRAMQIIAELEASRRGIYCGNVLWLGYDGAIDSNIAIRSIVLTPERVIVGAGGGIVADSDPDAEYNEMMLKAAPMLGIFDG